jgi:alpha-tubulin suppressor-like RCC1 family protein
LKSTATPALVDLQKVDQIAAGNHSAAISNGNLYIWGSGCFGNYSKPTLFIRDMVDVKVNGTLGIGLNN